MANKGTRLSERERERLNNAVGSHGTHKIAASFRVSDHTIIKASAGYPVQRSIAELIRLKLDLEDDE